MSYFLIGYEYRGEFKPLARGTSKQGAYADWYRYTEEPLPSGCFPIPATEAAYEPTTKKRIVKSARYSHGELVDGLVDVA